MRRAIEIFEENKYKTRRDAYQELGFTGFTENDFEHPDEEVRLEAYKNLGFTDQAFTDSDWFIRFEAYKALGFTEKALKDQNPRIRLNAYKKLGFTEKALNDPNKKIRQEATEYFINCASTLDLKKGFKIEFTENEALLLKINNLVVNEKIIINP